MVGWHHRCNGHEFKQALGVGDGQGSLACCSPWGCKESDVTERLNEPMILFKCGGQNRQIYGAHKQVSDCQEVENDQAVYICDDCTTK